MQRPDEKKRALITETAARLFATHPFHKVRLDDIAAEAKIGKGTLYIYFDSKEDLYFSLISDGFVRQVDDLRGQLGEGIDVNGDSTTELPSPREGLRRIVAGLVRFGFAHPHFFELIRTIGTSKAIKGQTETVWNQKRQELQQLITDTIRRGVESGELCDPQPELTALFLPGMVRSAMLFGPRGLDEAEVTRQILRLLEHGIGRPVKSDNDCQITQPSRSNE